MYQWVLAARPGIKSDRFRAAYWIASLIRGECDAGQARQIIWMLLTDERWFKYRKMLIQETFELYPQVYIDFFEQYPEALKHPKFVAMCIAYLVEQGVSDKAIALFRHQSSMNEIDRLYLENNLYNLSPAERMELLNQVLDHNQLMRLTLKNTAKGFCVTNLKATQVRPCESGDNTVTVLMTAFNAEKTIVQSIDSLLNQSWQALDIIVIDDASTDRTAEVVRTAFGHHQVRLICLPKNVGTFAAKSIGANFATGEYLTCQDADDFAHPQKIEKQIIPLINNPALQASVSYSVRILQNGHYYTRKYYPFLRLNPTSLMFRKERVEHETGLWHLVRTGADSELYARLKTVYGDDGMISIRQPLTIGSSLPNSLMNCELYGTQNKASRLRRLAYMESWRCWHIDQLSKHHKIQMPKLVAQVHSPVFDLDAILTVDGQAVLYNCAAVGVTQ